MSFMHVDDFKCTRCGICAELCPVGIISLQGEGVPAVGYAQAAACIKCGQCVIYCPTCANSLAFQDEDEVIRVSDLELPGTEAGLNLLRTRRSVRRFKPDAVSEREFAKLFDTVKMAPSASNSQAVRWVVTRNREKTEEIQALVLDWFRGVIAEDRASRMGIVGAYAIAQAAKGKDMILRGAPNVVIAVTQKDVGMPEDGVIALTYVELAAHAMGLGCCWGGFLTAAARQYGPLREYLGISDDEYFCGAQMMGYPELLPSRQFPPRKNPNISWIK